VTAAHSTVAGIVGDDARMDSPIQRQKKIALLRGKRGGGHAHCENHLLSGPPK